MKNHLKNLAFAFTLAILSPYTFAQHWCATHTLVEQEIKANPEKAAHYEQLWNMSSSTSMGKTANSRGTAANPYIIPVVFHVVHDNGIGNIPYEQILSAVEVLNEDYRRMNADTGNTRDVFKPFAVDSDIEFRLAKIDPDGNCTNGVVRINSPQYTYDVRNEVKSVSYWPSNQYLNIWVVNSIENFSGGSGIVLGYAQFPGGSWNTYGIVNRHDRLGKMGIGTSVSDGRTLTHEVGHCLNLLHTFQSGCGGNCSTSGDRVCDTPPSLESTFGCSQTQNTCSNDMSGTQSVYGTDVVDQIENYMSYDDCQNMFSVGQRDRMHAVLTGISELVNLVSESNLMATGVLDTTQRICKAEFETNTQTICLGQVVEFTDMSYFNPSGHVWEFPGGNPTQSNDTNPEVVYTQPGTYPVTLTVTDGTDSVTTTKTQFITVLPNSTSEAPVTEGFEFASSDLSLNNWYTANTGTTYGWELSTSESYSGSSSLLMRQYGATDGTAEVLSPNYSFSGYEEITVSFKLAYAQTSTTSNDILRIFVSEDCGENWVLRFVKGGSSMATMPNANSPISNLSQADWEENSFVVNSAFLSENFRMKFEVLTDGGNNLYIDDINITGVKSDVPALVYPINGYAQASVDETLDWKSSALTDEYEILLDTTPNFNSSLLRIKKIPYVNTASNGTDTEWKPGNLQVGFTYYWKVRSVIGNSPSNWSNTWAFTVSSSAPPLGVENEQNETITLYPNPANGVIRFAGVNMVNELRIYNTTGNLVKQGSFVSEADVSNLSTGVYIVELTTSTQTTKHKLIIEH